MAEYNEYTIKNDNSFKYHLPNVGHSGVSSIAVGLGVGLGVGAVSVLTGGLAIGVGAMIGAGVAVGAGAGSLFTMMGINYLDNFSKSHFAKIEKENGKEYLYELIQNYAELARYIEYQLTMQPNMEKFELLGEEYSRSKITKLKKKFESIAYYGLKYELGKAEKLSGIINSLQFKKQRKADETRLLEGSKLELEAIKECIRLTNWSQRDTDNFIESNGVYTPTTNPYKDLITNAISKGCLLGGTPKINDDIYRLSHNITGEEEDNQSAEKIYSVIYETPVRSTLESIKNARIKAMEDVNADYESSLKLIDKLIEQDTEEIKLTNKQRKLQDKISRLTDYIALIKQANSLTIRMPSNMAKDQNTLLGLSDKLKQAMASEDNVKAESLANTLNITMQDIGRKIDGYNQQLGRNEIQNEFNTIITLTKQSLDSTANVLITSLVDYSKTNPNMDKKLNDLNKYRSQAKMSSSELNKYNTLVQDVSNQLRLLYVQQVSKSKELNDKLDMSNLAVQGLSNDNTQLAKTIKLLESNEEELTRRLGILGSRVKELKNTTQEERDKHTKASEQISSYVRGLQATKHFLETISDLKSERIESLMEQNMLAKEGEASAKKAQAKAEQAKSKAEKSSRRDRILRTVAESERDSAVKENNEVKEENRKLTTANTVLEVQHQKDTEWIDEAGDIIANLTRKVEDLQNKKARLLRMSSKQKIQNNVNAQTIKNLENEINVLQTNIDTLQEENTNSQKTIKSLRKTNTKQKVRINQDAQIIRDSQDYIEGLQAQTEALQGENTKLGVKIKNQQGIIASQQAQRSILDRELEDKDEEIESQQYIIDQLGLQIQDLDNNLSNVLDDSSRLREDNSKLRKERDSLEDDFVKAAEGWRLSEEASKRLGVELYATTQELRKLEADIKANNEAYERAVQQAEQDKQLKNKNMQDGRIRSDLHKKICKIQSHMDQVAYDVSKGKIVNAEQLTAILDGNQALQDMLALLPSREERKVMPIEQIMEIKRIADKCYDENVKGWPKFKATHEERNSKYKIDTSGYDK